LCTCQLVSLRSRAGGCISSSAPVASSSMDPDSNRWEQQRSMLCWDSQRWYQQR
jgi:hypothetical protein